MFPEKWNPHIFDLEEIGNLETESVTRVQIQELCANDCGKAWIYAPPLSL